jgi:hypothetical protein|tara:strand:- start:1500 stop:1991 length:492 start_codon:yes stop_codon:yes gene_type:complete
MDLKHILTNDEKSENVSIKKKTKYVPNISNNQNNSNNDSNNYSNKSEIDDLLEKEKNNLYKNPWNKLDNTTKNNLFKKYILLEKESYSLDDNQTSILHNLLIKNIKKINKNSDVDYNSEEGVLNKIHILAYDEVNKSFSLNFTQKKSKSATKSKSNLDKFMKS